jgi:hypothetical protein
MTSIDSPIVVDTGSVESTEVSDDIKVKCVPFIKRYGSALVVVALIIIVLCVNQCKEGFSSPDGVVANSSAKKQVRSDTEVDRTWNLQELEKSVKLLNRKS